MDSQINPYYISNTTSVCDAGATNAPLPNLPTAGTAYECPTWKLNSGPLWMGLGCLAIMTILMSRSFKVSHLTQPAQPLRAYPLNGAAVPLLKAPNVLWTQKAGKKYMHWQRRVGNIPRGGILRSPHACLTTTGTLHCCPKLKQRRQPSGQERYDS